MEWKKKSSTRKICVIEVSYSVSVTQQNGRNGQVHGDGSFMLLNNLTLQLQVSHHGMEEMVKYTEDLCNYFTL